MKSICVLPGDGIGPEVVGSALSVLRAVTDELEFTFADIGGRAYEEYGTHLPPETLEAMKEADSCLFGAVTSSEDPSYDSPVLRFRKELDLFANVRPIRNLVAMKDKPRIDIVIVRENLEGMYTRREVFDDDGVTTLRKISQRACGRIVDFAIRFAREAGRQRICCVHKSNVLRASDGLFVRTFRELMRSKAKNLTAEEQLVDTAAMKLVLSPQTFDVIVTLNLYGDILSGVGAAVAGGPGFVPSGNIGPVCSVFEPAHGSAPDIQGRGVANPTAAVLAGAMMLRHLGMTREANEVEAAVAEFYASGHLTVDLGGRHGSKSFTEHVIRNLRTRGDR